MTDDRNETTSTPDEGGTTGPVRGPGSADARADSAAPGPGRADARSDAATGRAADIGHREDDLAEVTPADIETDLENLRRDLEKTTDRQLRLAAEFDNYRKRVERERAEYRSRGQAELASRLLEVMDDLDRVAALEVSESAQPLLDGVQLVHKKLNQVMGAFGLEAVDAAGERFDPATMEAVAMVEVPEPAEDEMVADVFQAGYRFNGQLLRPARVRVKKYGA
jgi:molecular chaperone GrpE